MSPENFVYWLQGWIELNKTIDHRGGATEETLKCIEDHLNLVLKKDTPKRKQLPEMPPIPVQGPTIVDAPFPWPQDTIKTPFQVPAITC